MQRDHLSRDEPFFQRPTRGRKYLWTIAYSCHHLDTFAAGGTKQLMDAAKRHIHFRILLQRLAGRMHRQSKGSCPQVRPNITPTCLQLLGPRIARCFYGPCLLFHPTSYANIVRYQIRLVCQLRLPGRKSGADYRMC